MSVLRDRDGTRYIEGAYGAYAIDSLTYPIDHDPIALIDTLLTQLSPAHPDIDLLLDARNELIQEQP